MFWITFGVLTVTTLVYVIWASGDKQSWNDDPSEENWLRELLDRRFKSEGDIQRDGET